MKLKEFSYLVPPQDLVKDSLDVFVVLEDGSNYVVEVTTPKFLEETLMGDGDFLEPHDPYIIVSKLTDEIIKAAIEEYISVEEI